MATLSKHGELGQIEKLAYKLAFCADGKILRNDGSGWKCWRKLKPGVDPAEHFKAQQDKYAEKLATMPMFRAWRDAFHEAFPFRLRNLALNAISMMPDDPDGVYSELNDYGYLFREGELLSCDEAVHLCQLYRMAKEEGKAYEASKQAVPA